MNNNKLNNKLYIYAGTIDNYNHNWIMPMITSSGYHSKHHLIDNIYIILSKLGINIFGGIVWCNWNDPFNHDELVHVELVLRYSQDLKMTLPTITLNGVNYYIDSSGNINNYNNGFTISNYITTPTNIHTNLYFPTSFKVLVDFIKIHRPEIYDLVKKLLYSNDESNYIIACEMICNAFNIKLEEDVCNKA